MGLIMYHLTASITGMISSAVDWFFSMRCHFPLPYWAKLHLTTNTLRSSVVFTTRQRSCGKVMFSVVSVCSRGEGFHVTITHDALDLTVQETCSNLKDWPPLPSEVTSGGDYWTTHDCGAGGQYASYWKVFLFSFILIKGVYVTF